MNIIELHRRCANYDMLAVLRNGREVIPLPHDFFYYDDRDYTIDYYGDIDNVVIYNVTKGTYSYFNKPGAVKDEFKIHHFKYTNIHIQIIKRIMGVPNAV